MDENKRDEIKSEEPINNDVTVTDENAVVAEEAASDINEEAAEENSNGLAQELEELRDMFQQELDKAKEEAEISQDTLIQELDEIEEIQEEAEEFTGRLCEICEANPCATEYGEDYPYCEECRNAMKKYPMRASGILMTLVMIAVFIATAVAGTEYIDAFMSVSEYAAYYDTGRLMTALNGYYAYNSSASADKISMKAVKDSIEGFVKTGYVSDAISLIEKVFTEDQLKLPWNKKYAKIIEDANALTESYYAITDIITPVMNGEEDDYDKVMADLDALYEATDEEGNNKNINPVFIEYYRYVAMSVMDKEPEELLRQLEKAAFADKDGNLQWVYLSNYANLAARCGDLELTELLYNRMIGTSKEDVNAYIALASYYRFADDIDADKMLEIMEEAKANAYQQDFSYMPYMAIAYMLKGEGSVAMTTMKEYMSMSGYTVQTCNLFALCALYNGDEATYKEMKDVLETSGYKLSNLVEKYRKDKISIEEALTDIGGDI